MTLLPVDHPQIKCFANGFAFGVHQGTAATHRSHADDGQLHLTWKAA